MKIPKTLLGAILVGIAVQTTVSSCTKKDNESLKGSEQKKATNQQPEPYYCPACGMG